MYLDGEIPFKRWKIIRVWLEVHNGFRIEQPVDMPDELYLLAMACWSESDAFDCARLCECVELAYQLFHTRTTVFQELRQPDALQSERHHPRMAAINMLASSSNLATWFLDDLSRSDNFDESEPAVTSSRWAVNPETHRWKRISDPSPLEWTRLQSLGKTLDQLPVVEGQPDVGEISGITMALEGEMAFWHDAAASYVRGCETLLA
eukprot:TRINITY_DN12581_c1_g1_i1.p3 TRINITY_DN12581_c1_g1~~TRINITY_DN12581_c1_g1_i1.p3  ORF type:complete len:206 (+),score=37.66 TRINITY_DN12581_c1_g1_i1:850-1467(+)